MESRGPWVEVSDTGPGVDPLVEKKLFQPFVTTKGEKGTGLGLWVSLGIVQKHGGSMHITNIQPSTRPALNGHGQNSTDHNGSEGADDNQAAAPRGACVRIYLPAQYDGGIPASTSGAGTETVAESAAQEEAGAFHLPS